MVIDLNNFIVLRGGAGTFIDYILFYAYFNHHEHH